MVERNPFVPFSLPQEVERNNPVGGLVEVDRPPVPTVNGVGDEPTEKNPFVPFSPSQEVEDSEHVGTGQPRPSITDSTGSQNPNYVPTSVSQEVGDDDDDLAATDHPAWPVDDSDRS